MKYLKIIIFACIVLQTTFMFSQSNTFECDFIPEASMFDTSKYTATVKSNFSSDEPVVFNVKFHILVEENGVEPYGVTENKLLEHIAQLNINLNQFNLFYKYRGFEEHSGIITYNFGNETIIGPVYDAPSGVILNHLDLVNNYPNSINVLLTRNLSPGANANLDKQRVNINASRVMSSAGFGTMIHEFGHLAGLLHVFEGTQYAPRCLTEPDGSEFCIENDTIYQANSDHDGDVNNGNEIGYAPPRLNIPRLFDPGQDGYGNDENVTRDTNNPNYNAKLKGDLVIDTPAQFLGSEHNFFEGITDYFGIGYHYITHSSIVDSVGEMYDNIDVQNFMSYTELLMTNFTNGQGVRMRETIENNPDIFNRVKTEVASLYEPYAGEYYAVGPTTSNHLTKFQPGFDYTFIQCGGDSHNYGIEIYNQPTDYDNISFLFSSNGQIFDTIDKFSLDFETMFHPNHSAIFIQQLNQFSLNDGGQPHKCYNNFNRSSIGGTVIKFEDDTLTNNITTQQKNAQEINDTNLIQDLQQGLYRIEKNYDDGSKKETLIYKTDN